MLSCIQRSHPLDLHFLGVFPFIVSYGFPGYVVCYFWLITQSWNQTTVRNIGKSFPDFSRLPELLFAGFEKPAMDLIQG